MRLRGGSDANSGGFGWVGLTMRAMSDIMESEYCRGRLVYFIFTSAKM